jgi:hypothetical protein
MNIKQKIMTFLIAGASIVALTTTLAPLASAAETCGGVKTSIIKCDQTGTGPTAKDSGVWGVLLLVLNIMTAGIGILAVGGIVYGSVLYASAQEDAGQVKQAKDIIKNVIIGIIAYGGMYLLLNFLIPGGIFT